MNDHNGTTREPRCRVCGCSEREPCEPPCGWDQPGLCTGCAITIDALAEWLRGAHRVKWAALWREVAALWRDSEAKKSLTGAR